MYQIVTTNKLSILLEIVNSAYFTDFVQLP